MSELDPFELEILRSTLGNQQKEIEEDLEQNLLCECRCVSFAEVIEYLHEEELDLNFLAEKYGIGRGCGSCLKTISNYRLKIQRDK